MLLKCGFDTVEVGSFVSPKLIPQMADTADVLKGLDLSETKSKIAVLVATEKGGQLAVGFEQVDQVFFPFSISSTFLNRNIKKTIEEAVITVYNLQNLCIDHNKDLVIFFSMGFGDAYGDPYSIELLIKYIEIFVSMGITTFPFSDIIGEAKPKTINSVFVALREEFKDVEFGLHLHSLAEGRLEKIDAAYKAGIRRFDTVISGIGGCPQTGMEMIGNLPLRDFTKYCGNNNIPTGLNESNLLKAESFLKNHITL